MHCVADILDKQIVDVDGQKAGKVDGIVMELRDGAPPKLTYLEVSPITLIRRVSTTLARWYALLDRRLGPDRGVPYRIPWTRARPDGPTLRVDFRARETPIFAAETWVRDRIVAHIPWSDS
jgi:sporulation protein YlmC with PRC-barrel domain